MRPPEFTGGNPASGCGAPCRTSSFNEAAGIHRRKPDYWAHINVPVPNASMRPAETRNLPSVRPAVSQASMRPPEFTGGNASPRRRPRLASATCFNEAAGIHRRKQLRFYVGHCDGKHASMRPPEFTGGNLRTFRHFVLRNE